MRLDRGDAVGLARALIQCDSRNPSLVSGAPGEGAIARLLAGVLDAWGFRVELHEAAPGRPNVVARIGTAAAPTRTLMFNGHLDTVGVDGMTHPPFEAAERDGRMYGRGSSDMKSGVAAMCAAAALAADGLGDGALVVTGVVDEEFASLGTRALVDGGLRTDAAIVAEPTGLAIMPAHRGFVWLDLAFHGRAAHGSRYEIGIDAIRHAGLVLAELDALESGSLVARTHPLLGHASLHASLIAGGTGMSTYPDQCTLQVERRTLPGETAAQVLAEVQLACANVRRTRPELRVDVTVSLAQNPSDVATDAPIALALREAIQHLGLPVRVEGMSAWTDCAILNDAGIPAICFGPGDISLAHGPKEFVDVEQVRVAAAVLERLARRWSVAGGAAWPT